MAIKTPSLAESQRRFRTWLLSHDSIVSLRCALTFCTGTLFCMLPGYPKLWFSGLALADQISFTLLGGVSKPVGGCWEQLFYRFGGGVVLGTPCYILLALLERQYTVQGVLFALFVFLLSWIGSHSKFVGGGALFAQTACSYAVANSYRHPGSYNLHNLWDLLQCWFSGVLICLFYNFVFFPKFASNELLLHTERSLNTVQQAIDFLYSTKETTIDAQSLSDKLSAEIDTSSVLLRQASWEVAHQSATWEELRQTVIALDKLRVILFTSVLDRCAYRMLKPDTAAILRQPAADCHQALSNVIARMKASLQGSSDTSTDVIASLLAAQASFTHPSTALSKKMLENLSSITQADAKITSHLFVATHCVSLAGPLAEHVKSLHDCVSAYSSRPRTWQFRVLRGSASIWTYLPSKRLLELFMLSTDRVNAFLPTPSIAQRVMRLLTTDQAIGALKITIALLAMMSILWADESRQWFLQHNIQTATVPLILALMPTLGGSMLAWMAELFGTFSGAVWGFVTMLVWRNVGGAAFSVPGVSFFQLLYTLCLSWRLAWGRDDMLAVLGCFALGAYINTEFQLRHSDPPQSLPRQLGTACIVICIAIGIAIPLQFLVMRKSARQSGRLALADSMRDVGEVHESVGKLFTHLLLDTTIDEARIATETASLRSTVSACRSRLLALRGYVKEAQAEFGTHDGWLAERYIKQIAACHRTLAACDISARILSMGPFDPQVLAIISPDFANSAVEFSSSTSSVLWCHAAALSLLKPLPGTLPSVEQTMASVLLEVGAASQKAANLGEAGPRVETDLRRFWQLSHLLISQGSTLEQLEILLSAEWKPSDSDIEQADEVDYTRPQLERSNLSTKDASDLEKLASREVPLPTLLY